MFTTLLPKSPMVYSISFSLLERRLAVGEGSDFLSNVNNLWGRLSCVLLSSIFALPHLTNVRQQVQHHQAWVPPVSDMRYHTNRKGSAVPPKQQQILLPWQNEQYRCFQTFGKDRYSRSFRKKKKLPSDQIHFIVGALTYTHSLSVSLLRNVGDLQKQIRLESELLLEMLVLWQVQWQKLCTAMRSCSSLALFLSFCFSASRSSRSLVFLSW